jgi:hypothetical protein
VDALPKAARRCWKEALSRTFDIGIQAGLEPRSFEEVKLKESTLKDVVRLSARVLVTVYAPYDESTVQRVTPPNFAMERSWPSSSTNEES